MRWHPEAFPRISWHCESGEWSNLLSTVQWSWKQVRNEVDEVWLWLLPCLVRQSLEQDLVLQDLASSLKSRLHRKPKGAEISLECVSTLTRFDSFLLDWSWEKKKCYSWVKLWGSLQAVVRGWNMPYSILTLLMEIIIGLFKNSKIIYWNRLEQNIFPGKKKKR